MRLFRPGPWAARLTAVLCLLLGAWPAFAQQNDLDGLLPVT